MNPNWLHEPDNVALRACFDAQQARVLSLRASTARSRIEKLGQLKHALLAHRQELYQAFDQDFRKPEAEVDLTELLTVIDEIRTATKHLGAWMRPRRTMPTLTTLGTKARVTYQPKGRCLIIGPWNYPVATLIGPLVSAVAAGNAVILKPSEFTPNVNAVLAAVIADVFAPDEVSIVTGGVTAAQALLECPFDHIFFTGSPAVGTVVMTAAAKHLASVTLELGGKSPVIVDETADLRAAAEVTMWGKLVNAGQTCIAPDTLFVQRSVHDEFLRLCRETIGKHFGASDAAIAASPDLARMIHDRHCQRMVGLIENARHAGALIEVGGNYDLGTRFVAPTLLTNLPATAQISQEEIFGPILPIHAFDTLDEVIHHINAHPKPLALYLWSNSHAAVRRVLAKTSSGSAVVNHCLQQFAHSNLPFGGVNHSGIGNSHGIFGFKAFSHERAMLSAGRLRAVKLFFPPYTATTRRMIKLLLALIQRI